VGAIATGMLTGWPTMVEASVRLVMSTATRWRSLIRSKSEELARNVPSVYEPDSM
jgi:hypothetical protein